MEKQKKFISQLRNMFVLAKRLLALIWKMDRWLTVQMVIQQLISFTTPLLVAFVAKLFIDELVTTVTTVGIISFALIIVFALKYIGEGADRVVQEVWWKHYLNYIFRYRFQSYINTTYYERLTRLDVPYFESPKDLNTMGKAQSSLVWNTLSFAEDLFNVLGAIALFIITLIISASFGWYIPLIIIAIVGVRFYLKLKHGNLQWAIFDAAAEENRQLWYLRNLLSGPESQKEVRIFGVQQTILQKINDIQNRFIAQNTQAVKQYSGMLLFAFALEIVALAILSYTRLDDVAHGLMSIGAFTFFIATLERLSVATSSISTLWGDLQVNGLYVTYFFEVMDLPVLIAKPSIPARLEGSTPPKIEFKNVDFAYPNGKQVLSNVSFIIEPGEHVAIVGENGVGKSTLIKLLCRFYDVTGGVILINNTDIRELDTGEWYQCLGTLFQDFNKYNFTAEENIALGEQGPIDKTKIKQSADKSGASSFIEQFPQKFEQMLGRSFSDGQELSQGQWQKMALARAFYRDAPILILDEPTSAIDAKSEYEIFQSLEGTSQGKTLILVSHRFSTVRNADRILVIEQGKILENGSHEQLMSLKGVYEKMFSLQAEGYQ